MDQGLDGARVAVLNDADAGHPLAVQVGDAAELDQEGQRFYHFGQLLRQALESIFSHRCCRRQCKEVRETNENGCKPLHASALAQSDHSAPAKRTKLFCLSLDVLVSARLTACTKN